MVTAVAAANNQFVAELTPGIPVSARGIGSSVVTVG
jgi:hypothetical protein